MEVIEPQPVAQNWLLYHPYGFPLHSGGRSILKVSGHGLFADEPVRRSVLNYWIKAINTQKPQVPIRIVGIPSGGIPWAEALAERLGVQLLHRTDLLETKATLIVVDDVVTTGESMRNIQNAAIRVAVVDRREVSKPDLLIHAWMRIELPQSDA